MPPSREVIHADEDETTPLAGVAQAASEAEPPPDAALVARTRREEYLKKLQRIVRVPPTLFPWWRRLPFLGPTCDCVAVGQPLYAEQIEMLRKSNMPGHFKQLALDRQFATFCLNDYNSSHLDDKYEPAPGKVTKHYRFYHGARSIHGNFVARRKRSGWLSFLLSFLLPATRTLFFFEISSNGYSREVVTCTPLDERVTEAYSVFGFPLGCSKRRSGKSDTICRTCSQRFYLPHRGIETKPQCEHDNARKVCEMCYNHSIVLHPDVFKFGIPGP